MMTPVRYRVKGLIRLDSRFNFVLFAEKKQPDTVLYNVL